MGARTQRQMSRAALAEQAGVSLQLVAELESGYPVARESVSAICRNLELPEPAPESSPLIRLALLVRQRRGLARLSRAQLAEKAGLTSQIIRSLETATLQPSHQICMALLTVKGLELQESDVAAFLSLPSVEGNDGVPRPAGAPSSIPGAGTESRGRLAPPSAPQSRAGFSRSAERPRAARSPLGNKVVATFLVRFHASGKVSIEMRPNRKPPSHR